MKKLNNKGFSLVELIIVIAIMAILVGVVGTQVIPYLENSRKAKDIQVISSWNTAGMSAYSTCAGKLTAGTDYTITITGSGVSGDADLVKVFCELTGLKKTGGSNQITSKMVSKAGSQITQVDIEIKDGGDITTKVTGGDFDTIENK